MKRYVIPALAVLIAASLVSPAMGGPSVATIAKQAKKALKQSKRAQASARSATSAAQGAHALAGQANTTAGQALAAANAKGALMLVTSPRAAFGPSDLVQQAIAFCPSGQRVVSGGGVSITDEQLAASFPLSDRSGWAVIGVDLVDNGGEYVEADALCAPAGLAVASSRSRARREVARVAERLRPAAGDGDRG